MSFGDYKSNNVCRIRLNESEVRFIWQALQKGGYHYSNYYGERLAIHTIANKLLKVMKKIEEDEQ